MKQSFDVIIVGRGMVGLTTALMLTRDASLSVLVMDAAPLSLNTVFDDYRVRVAAITLASQSIFESLGVWQQMVQHRVSPFEKIEVYARDQRVLFDSSEIGEARLGYIIENDVIMAVLLDASKHITFISPVVLKSIQERREAVLLQTETHGDYSAKLLIAADGKHSWVRDQLGIQVDQKDYHQSAIVCAIKTENPHQKIARQWFINDTILAFLPLDDPHAISIVWSLNQHTAKENQALSDEAFIRALQDACKHELGEMTLITKRLSFPLAKQAALRYIGQRTACVGDAAHLMHPLAGQGVNVGLQDALTLSNLILNAHSSHQDIGSHQLLRKYERTRKAENFPLLFGVDSIKSIFASEHLLLKSVSTCGMNIAKQSRFIKNCMMKLATGK